MSTLIPSPDSVVSPPAQPLVPLRRGQTHPASPISDTTNATITALSPTRVDSPQPIRTQTHPLHQKQHSLSVQQGHGAPLTAPSPSPSPDPHALKASTKDKPTTLRVRIWAGFCVAFVILAPLLSIIIGYTQHAQQMMYPQTRDNKFNGRTLLFEVVLIAADPKLGIMRLDWKITGEENSPCTAGNLSPCTDVNIFFDTNLLRAEGILNEEKDAEILNSFYPDRPLFIYNARGLMSKDIKSKTPTFRTQLALFSPGDHPSSLMYYPFDRYTAEIIFYAEEVGTNRTVGTRIDKTRGIAVGFETTISHRHDTEIPPGLTEAVITLTRSRLVQSYSIVSTIAVWIVTLILVLVMITSVFFRYRQRPEVLLIPVATLFAFTQLRQSMPGAPDGFGDVVDLVGLVPCLGLLALTAAFSLGIFLLSDPSADRLEQLSWDDIQKALPFLSRQKQVTGPATAQP